MQVLGWVGMCNYKQIKGFMMCFGCRLEISQWLRQEMIEGSVKIFPIISERLSFSKLSFGKLAGLILDLFFLDEKFLLTLFPLLLQVALISALT